jgi:hypothetical protein
MTCHQRQCQQQMQAHVSLVTRMARGGITGNSGIMVLPTAATRNHRTIQAPLQCGYRQALGVRASASCSMES